MYNVVTGIVQGGEDAWFWLHSWRRPDQGLHRGIPQPEADCQVGRSVIMCVPFLLLLYPAVQSGIRSSIFWFLTSDSDLDPFYGRPPGSGSGSVAEIVEKKKKGFLNIFNNFFYFFYTFFL